MAVHPDYPITFKPAIAKVDWDQTYDIMQFVLLPTGSQLMSLARVPFFDYIAVDRYTPWEYPWCDEYSKYLYDLIKTFNYCPHNTFSGLTTDVHNLQTLAASSLYVPTTRLDRNVPNPVTFTAGDYIFTWLNLDRDQSSLISDGCQTLNKVYKTVSFAQDTTFDLLQFLNGINQEDNQSFYLYGFCANSLVITKKDGQGGFINYRPSGIPIYWLYEDIGIYFNQLKSELLNFFQVRYDLDGVQDRSGEDYLGSKFMPLGHYLLRVEKDVRISNSGTTRTIAEESTYRYTTAPLPQFFRQLCYLKIANNNLWGNSNTNLIDEGITVTPSVNHQFLRYSYIPSITTGTNLYRSFGNPIELKQERKCLGGVPYDIYHGYNYGYYQHDLPSYYDWQNQAYNLLKLNLTNANVIAFIEANRDNRNSHTVTTEYVYDVPARQSGLYIERKQVVFQGNTFTLDDSMSYTDHNIGFMWRTNIDGTRYKQFNQDSAWLGANYNLSQGTNYLAGFSFNSVDFVETTGLLQPDPATSDIDGVLSFIVSDLEYGNTNNNPRVLNLTPYVYATGFNSPNEQITNINQVVTLYTEFSLISSIDFLQWYDSQAILADDYLTQLYNFKETRTVVDSVRVKEIHACLGATEAATLQNGSPVVMNIARKLDLLCKTWGVSFNLDGTFAGYQSPRYFEDLVQVPAQGWHPHVVGVNEGWETQQNTAKSFQGLPTIDNQRVGVLYEIKSARLDDDPNNATGINRGGWIACNNLVQYWDAMQDDLDKALGWQYLGTGIVNVNGKSVVYEGLCNFLQEAYTVQTDTNKTTEETRLGVGIIQQITKEILKGLGLPGTNKTFKYELQSSNPQLDLIDPQTGKRISLEVPYPALTGDSPTIVDLIITVLANLGIQNVSTLNLKSEEIKQMISQVTSSNP